MFRRVLFACLALLPVAAAPAAAQVEPVDLELILAVDISRSMDFDEHKLQRDGYVAAIAHPDVVSAITQGLHGRIALTYVEWAGPATQAVVVDWQVIDGPAAARRFAEELARVPIQRLHGTSISSSLAFVAPRFDTNAHEGIRRVIDVSGDGPNNMGPPVEAARDAVLARGITINGLPIMIKKGMGFSAIGDLDVYYEDCFIGGPGAFIVPVHAAAEFAVAIRRKLVLEIAGRQPELVPAQAAGQPRRIDCLIGEKLRQQWMRE